MEQSETVSIQFEESSDYRLAPADGAWGGPTPRGRIMVNFFVDVPTSPYSVTHDLTETGELGEEIQRTPTPDAETPRVKREFQTGVLLSIEDAEGIAHWLLDQVRAMREDMDG